MITDVDGPTIGDAEYRKHREDATRIRLLFRYVLTSYDSVHERAQQAVEGGSDDRVTDLHVWRVGPRHLAAIVSVITHEPKEPAHYKALLAEHGDLVHVSVEVHRCPDQAAG